MASSAPTRDSVSQPATRVEAEGVPAAGRARTIELQVLERRPAARDAVTFTFALPGTRRAPAAYQPGQFITLSLLSAGGGTQQRSYSLCGDGRAEVPWEITVKRTAGGLISNFLIDQVRTGMLLRTSLPQGNFTLPSVSRVTRPLVFVAAGSGITPIYAMLRALALRDPTARPRIWLHYAYHSPADAIFGPELAALDPSGRWLVQRHYVSSSGARLQPDDVVQSLGAEAGDADWYVCGPAAVKRGVEDAARRRGVAAERVHAEVFASPQPRRDLRGVSATGARAPVAARLRLAESGAVLDARPGETLLETLEQHGYRPEFSCRAGACGTCRLRVVRGRVCNGEGENGALSAAERAGGYVLSCVGTPTGDVTLAGVGAPVAPPRRSASAAVSRGAAPRRPRQALRAAIAAATLGLFAGTWALTNHSPTASAASTTSSSSNSSVSGSSSSSASSSSSGTSGSSSITTQPSTSSPSTSTGVS
ncbi:MAG: 2Fe-2S iron-sulfur cluster-binding protein [Ktedonobacterales bacterium]